MQHSYLLGENDETARKILFQVIFLSSNSAGYQIIKIEVKILN